MACSVVFTHVINYEPRYRIDILPVQIFWNGIYNIVSIAVSCFFIMSGFLFYYNFDWSKLVNKWKRRIKSLLVPFVIYVMHCMILKIMKQINYAGALGKIIEPFVYTFIIVLIIIFINNSLRENKFTCNIWNIMLGQRLQRR